MTNCNQLPLLQQARLAFRQRFRGRVVLGATHARPWPEVHYCERTFSDPNEAAGDAQRQATVLYPEGELAGASLSADSVRA